MAIAPDKFGQMKFRAGLHKLPYNDTQAEGMLAADVLALLDEVKRLKQLICESREALVFALNEYKDALDALDAEGIAVWLEGWDDEWKEILSKLEKEATDAE